MHLVVTAHTPDGHLSSSAPRRRQPWRRPTNSQPTVTSGSSSPTSPAGITSRASSTICSCIRAAEERGAGPSRPPVLRTTAPIGVGRRRRKTAGTVDSTGCSVPVPWSDRVLRAGPRDAVSGVAPAGFSRWRAAGTCNRGPQPGSDRPKGRTCRASDVIIPCYRYADFLAESVGSVLATEGCDVRVLILDDASPDHTPEVAEALRRADSRVEYVRHATNRGNIAPTTRGLAWERADCLLCSPPTISSRRAPCAAAYLMQARPELSLVYGPYLSVEEGRPRPEMPSADLDAAHTIYDTSRFFALNRFINPVHTSTAVVRTAIQHKVGGYRAELTHSGDQEMWLRLACTAPSPGSTARRASGPARQQHVVVLLRADAARHRPAQADVRHPCSVIRGGGGRDDLEGPMRLGLANGGGAPMPASPSTAAIRRVRGR